MAAFQNEMSGALAVVGSGFAASTTGSADSASAGGDDCCDSPPPEARLRLLWVVIVSFPFSFQFFVPEE